MLHRQLRAAEEQAAQQRATEERAAQKRAAAAQAAHEAEQLQAAGDSGCRSAAEELRRAQSHARQLAGERDELRRQLTDTQRQLSTLHAAAQQREAEQSDAAQPSVGSASEKGDGGGFRVQPRVILGQAHRGSKGPFVQHRCSMFGGSMASVMHVNRLRVEDV